ncbi:MAG: hypothetical protein FJ351_03775 [Sphingomonadales bacterium]|nr:hypothetical protein [Sphingomonadales bacterium]
MITKQLLQNIRNQINPQLEAINKKSSDFSLRLGNCTYDSDIATFKLEVCSVEKGSVITKELSSLRQTYSIYGLTEADLTKEFATSRGKARLCGLKPRAEKCFIFEILDGQNKGKKYVTKLEAIKTYLGKTKGLIST